MERIGAFGRRKGVLAASIAIGFAVAWLCLSVRPAPGSTAFSFQPPAAKTNAPGEGLCTECHTGGLNLAGGSLAIQNAPAQYVAGARYSITVQLKRTGQTRWGFELTALRDSSGLKVQAGTFANTTNFTAIQSTAVAGKQRLYISHYLGLADGTYFGTADGPVTWTFDWTAPAQGAGAVTFYAAGNAANGNGTNGAGDVIYTATATSTEAAATAVTATTWGRIKRSYIR